jgi:hypothetical protein
VGKTNITILTASNENPKYLDCIPLYIDFWLLNNSPQVLYEIVPKVFLVAKKIPAHLEKYKEYIELIPEWGDLDSAFISQSIRLLKPALEKTDFVITSDVDMLPLNSKMIKHCLNSFGDSDHFILYQNEIAEREYLICYNFSTPKNWLSLMWTGKTKESDLEILRVLLNLRGGIHGYQPIHGHPGWTIDQEWLFSNIQQNQDLTFKQITQDDVKRHRLDRERHTGLTKWLASLLVIFGYFDDYHVHHPILKNLRYVNFLKKLIMVRENIKNFYSNLSR